jgi:hypothetical protein
MLTESRVLDTCGGNRPGSALAACQPHLLLIAGYASQNLGLKLGAANNRDHLGRPHCTGG